MGAKAAEKLKHRLADIFAADYVSELVAGNPQPLQKPQEDKLKIHLSDNKYLIIGPNHNEVPRLKLSMIDWSKVRRIKVYQIGDEK